MPIPKAASSGNSPVRCSASARPGSFRHDGLGGQDSVLTYRTTPHSSRNWDLSARGPSSGPRLAVERGRRALQKRVFRRLPAARPPRTGHRPCEPADRRPARRLATNLGSRPVALTILNDSKEASQQQLGLVPEMLQHSNLCAKTRESACEAPSSKHSWDYRNGKEPFCFNYCKTNSSRIGI